MKKILFALTFLSISNYTQSAEVKKKQESALSQQLLAALPFSRDVVGVVRDYANCWEFKETIKTNLEHITQLQLKDDKLIIGCRNKYIIFDLNTKTFVDEFISEAGWLKYFPGNRYISCKRDQIKINCCFGSEIVKSQIINYPCIFSPVDVELLSNNLLAGCHCDEVYLYNLTNKALLARLPYVKEIAWPSLQTHATTTGMQVIDEQLLAVSYTNGDIVFWDFHNKEIVKILHNDSSVWALKLLPGSILAAGASGGKIYLWDISILSNCKLVQILENGNINSVRALEFLPGGLLAAGRSCDGSIDIWHNSDFCVLPKEEEQELDIDLGELMDKQLNCAIL